MSLIISPDFTATGTLNINDATFDSPDTSNQYNLYLIGNRATLSNIIGAINFQNDTSGTPVTQATLTCTGQGLVSVSKSFSVGESLDVSPGTAASTITLGSTTGTGTIILGRSTAAQTIDIGVGATAASTTKTINIGTAGVSTSTTNINIGSATSNTTTDVYGILEVLAAQTGGAASNGLIKIHGKDFGTVPATITQGTFSLAPWLVINSGADANSFVSIQSANSAYTWTFNNGGVLTAPGNITTTGQLISTVATGTAPLSVSSTTKVTNLNADLLDGYSTGTSGSTIPLLNGTNTWSGINKFSSGVNNGNEAYPTYKFNLDFGSDVAGTWKRFIVASLDNIQYSTIGFKISITDPNANHAVTTSVNADFETYMVACIRTESTTLDTPDNCVVRGPGNRIRAVKTAIGSYEIQIQNEVQFREYYVEVACYAINGAHSVTYEPGTTAGSTGIAQYPASVGSSVAYFEKISAANQIVSTVTTGTAPLTVASTTVVTNLNADLLDGANTGTSGATIPLCNGANTFSGNTTFSGGTVTVGTSTGNPTYGLGTGATLNGNTKTINIGTSGVAGSTTNINIGSQASNNTTIIYGDIDQTYDVPQLGVPFASAIHYLEPQAGLTLSTVTLNVSTAVFSCTGTTTLSVNQVIRLTGTNTGALITGYVSGTDYYVISATGSPTTSFTLSATLGGASIAATGTTGSTGLNYTTATGATAFGTASPYVAGQTIFAGGAIPVLTLNGGTNTSSTVVIQTANNAYTWSFSNLGVLSAPGNITTSGQLISTVASGTAPLSVTSNTVVPNLNASLLSGNAIGTSGATIPLLNATNTFSGLTTFSNGVTVSGATTTLTTGTATVAPLTFASGTNLTTAAAGRVEYDGSFFYATRETTSGRGSVSINNIFRLAANGTAITTIANFYGATSAINLAASSVYDIEFHVYFTKTTAGTATFTLTASSAPTLIFAQLVGTPATGVGAGTPQSLSTSSQNATTAAFGATASLTTAVNHVYFIKGKIHTNLATTLNLQLACSAGSATPLAGSYYSIKRISATQGSFA